MLNKPSKPKSEYAVLFLRKIPKYLKIKFKMACLESEISMQKQIIKLMERFIEKTIGLHEEKLDGGMGTTTWNVHRRFSQKDREDIWRKHLEGRTDKQIAQEYFVSKSRIRDCIAQKRKEEE